MKNRGILHFLFSFVTPNLRAFIILIFSILITEYEYIDGLPWKYMQKPFS